MPFEIGSKLRLSVSHIGLLKILLIAGGRCACGISYIVALNLF